MNEEMTVRIIILLLWLTSFQKGLAAYQLQPVLSSGAHYPVHVAVAPGEPHTLYVVEQQGRVVVAHRGAIQRAAFLDIKAQVRSGGEMGLLSLAFHPEYNKKGSRHFGRYFVNYTATSPRLETVVAEFKRGKSGQKVILKIEQPYRNHNGGQLAFGKDGYLYIGMGDGGAGGDPRNYAQNLNSLLGKMLRIDVNGKAPYTIPAGNPLKKGRREIFAWGLRNPWRFSFDRKTGELFAADVGQHAWEEVDIIKKGKNYGWRVMEGTHCYKPKQNCPKANLEMPIHDYPSSLGQSVTGGFVYRGKRLPALRGAYIFGDYETGYIWALRKKKNKWVRETLMETSIPISSFGEELNGEILVVAHRVGNKPNLLRLTKKEKKTP